MYTSNLRCTAHLTLNRGRVKEYGSNRSVYLKDKQEFEIELFNPHQKSVLAKIYINGTLLSGGGLVIRPGQHVYLERYLDTNRKFKFETYEVENTKEAAQAIAKNGMLRVEFSYEKEPSYPTYYDWTIKLNNPTVVHNYGYKYTSPSIYDQYNNMMFCSTGTGTAIAACSANLSGCITTTNASYSTSVAGIPIASGSNSTRNEYANVKSLETGRVEKGDISSQALSTVYEEFNSWVSESTEIKILPFSQKPLDISEIRQYCTSCSTRIKKSSWKFCPTCGASLED